VESSDDHGRTPHYDHLEQLIPSLSIDPVNLQFRPGNLWFRPRKRVWFRLRKCFEWPKRLSTIEGIYPDIKDQAFVKVNIYEFSFRTRTDDGATHEVENDEGDEEEDDRDGGCPSQPGDLAG
jgi:hypothetical protein